MNFQLSEKVNPDKIFLVKRSELEGRLDTVFYKPLYRANEQAIKDNIWGFDSVRHIAHRIVDGPFGSDLKADEYKPSGVPLLRVSNLKTGAVEGDIVFISDEKHAQLKRSTVYPNDVVLTKAGAILGYSAVFPASLGEGNITSHLVTITCRKNIDPHYLSWFFRSSVGQLQIYRWGNKSTRPELNTGEVAKILVPLPSADIQRQIVAKMNDALTAKKQKETQAQHLFDSIDTFLLKALGIELPKEENSTINQRMFVRKFSEVSGGRFDPAYFEKRFTHLIQTIQQSSYKFVPLRTACSLLCSGKTPARDEYSEDSTPYPIIKVASYQGDLIDLNKADFAVSKQPYTVEKGDIFVLSAAHQPSYVGRFVKQLDDEPESPTSFVGELICLRANSSIINPYYLFGLFASNTFQTLMNREKRGQTSHIYSNDIKHILIPLPPLEQQNKIAAHIQSIRVQAKQLRAEAAASFVQAKQEVEAMIISV